MGLYKSTRKNGETYWGIDFYHNGKRHREVIGPSKKLAEDVLSKRKVEIAENKYLDKKKECRLTFEEFAKTYLENYAKPNKKSWKSTDATYLKALIPYFGKYRLNEITPLLIEKYRTKRKQEGRRNEKKENKACLKDASINHDLTCLSSIFKKAIEWNEFDGDNPVKKVKKYKIANNRIRYLAKEEYARLLEHCDDKLQSVLVLAVNTGLRKGEIQNISLNDVDWSAHTLTLRDQKNGTKNESIPLNETAYKLLLHLKLLAKQEKPFDYDWRTAFETAIKKANIRDFKWHDTRHTFASWLAIAGVELYRIMKLMRHKSVTMTQRYAHLCPNLVHEEVKRLDGIWSVSREAEKPATSSSVVTG